MEEVLPSFGEFSVGVAVNLLWSITLFYCRDLTFSCTGYCSDWGRRADNSSILSQFLFNCGCIFPGRDLRLLTTHCVWFYVLVGRDLHFFTPCCDWLCVLAGRLLCIWFYILAGRDIWLLRFMTALCRFLRLTRGSGSGGSFRLTALSRSPATTGFLWCFVIFALLALGLTVFMLPVTTPTPTIFWFAVVSRSVGLTILPGTPRFSALSFTWLMIMASCTIFFTLLVDRNKTIFCVNVK